MIKIEFTAKCTFDTRYLEKCGRDSKLVRHLKFGNVLRSKTTCCLQCLCHRTNNNYNGIVILWSSLLSVASNCLSDMISIFFHPHLWCNSQRACLEYVIDRAFEPRSGQTKDYTICICCFSAKHTAFRRKAKDWLAQNRDKVERYVYPQTVVSVSMS